MKDKFIEIKSTTGLTHFVNVSFIKYITPNGEDHTRINLHSENPIITNMSYEEVKKLIINV